MKSYINEVSKHNIFMKYFLLIIIVFTTCSSVGAGGKVAPLDPIKQAFIKSRKSKKPVLLFFTAWSVCDHTVEKILMTDKIVHRYLQDNYIVEVLKTDDKTKLSVNDQKDTILFNKSFKINTIGRRYMIYQISKFKVNWQPFMAILNEHEKLLLKPLGYTISRKEILHYLKNGVAKYKKTR